MPVIALPPESTQNARHAHVGNSARVRLAQALTDTGNGDRGAFRLVYTLTCSKLFGICIRICGDRSASEDVLAEVYLTVWKRAGAWDPARGSAMIWLATIARNRSIDWQRKRARISVAFSVDGLDFVDDTPDAQMAMLSAERNSEVNRSLAALAPHQQAAIRAAFFEDLTYAQLATCAGVPLGTMKSWVRRGLARMKADLANSEDL